MHSSKNTIVAILLLGVSYGVYQVITSPDPKLSNDVQLAVIAPDQSNANSGGAAAKSSSIESAKAALQADVKAKSISSPNWPASISFDTPKFEAKQSVDAPKLDPITSAPLLAKTDNPLADNSFSPSAEKPSVASPTSSNLAAANTLLRQMQPISQKPNTATNSFDKEFENNDRSFSNLEKSVSNDKLPTEPLANVWPSVDRLVKEEHFRDALEILTPYYRTSTLSAEDRNKLIAWLDALAGKVIFSGEHHLTSAAYIVQADDSLDTIASTWQVPTNLIFNINREKIADPLALVSGTELKQINGPFHAEIDGQSKMLTLFVDDLYACRFPIVACDANLASGLSRVTSKTRKDSQLGEYVVMLDKGLALHADQGKTSPNAITFALQDAKDLNEILSVGSTLTVVR